MKLELKGTDKLVAILKRKSDIELDHIVLDNLMEMKERGQASHDPSQGGTPYDSGDMLDTMMVAEPEVGYTTDYSPHVEYGHRTNGGGYVEGQHFLAKNLELQQPIFRQALIDEIKR